MDKISGRLFVSSTMNIKYEYILFALNIEEFHEENTS